MTALSLKNFPRARRIGEGFTNQALDVKPYVEMLAGKEIAEGLTSRANVNLAQNEIRKLAFCSGEYSNVVPTNLAKQLAQDKSKSVSQFVQQRAQRTN